MVSTREIAQDRVLAELAALGPDLDELSSRPARGSIDQLELMTQIREVACFVDRAQGQLARLVGVLDAISGASEAGYSSAVAFMRHACGRSPARGFFEKLCTLFRSLIRIARTRAAGEGPAPGN